MPKKKFSLSRVKSRQKKSPMDYSLVYQAADALGFTKISGKNEFVVLSHSGK